MDKLNTTNTLLLTLVILGVAVIINTVVKLQRSQSELEQAVTWVCK